MNGTHHVPPETRTFLAKQARRHKREHCCGHRTALDAVAKLHRFDNWKQVADGVSRWERTRRLFESGCVVAFEMKELEGSNLSEAGFVEESGLSFHCNDSLFEHIRNSIDERDAAGRPFRETEPDEVTRDIHENDLFSLCFFHLESADDSAPNTPESVHELLRHVAFWRPVHIWLDGVHHPVGPDANGAVDYHQSSVVVDGYYDGEGEDIWHDGFGLDSSV